MTTIDKWHVFRDEYVTAVWILALASGFYHLGMGVLGMFALSGREGVVDWVLLLTGFFVPIGASAFARARAVRVGWILIVVCFAFPLVASIILAMVNNDADLPGDVLVRVAGPSGIVGVLLLMSVRVPERRPQEEPIA